MRALPASPNPLSDKSTIIAHRCATSEASQESSLRPSLASSWDTSLPTRSSSATRGSSRMHSQIQGTRGWPCSRSSAGLRWRSRWCRPSTRVTIRHRSVIERRHSSLFSWLLMWRSRSSNGLPTERYLPTCSPRSLRDKERFSSSSDCSCKWQPRSASSSSREALPAQPDISFERRVWPCVRESSDCSLRATRDVAYVHCCCSQYEGHRFSLDLLRVDPCDRRLS